MHVWLIRHAKSAWSQPGLTDFDRPLNARGERDGPVMADWLSRQSDLPTWIWSSDAVRARTTAGFVHAVLPDAELQTDHRLYHAGPETILNLIRATPQGVNSVAIVAHNPGLTQMCNLLCATARINNLPTFGVTRFETQSTLADLQFGGAEITLLQTPKRLNAETDN
ncbi:MAG: histidine phosphatase family protein [Proteobacteria bacterium]|nr:histidine phosphatase family protein [Pseudomonadota bacterium]